MSSKGTELTTVADDLAVFHHGQHVIRHENLEPHTFYTEHGIDFHTLARPSGKLLSRIATVNDVHYGETECGRIDDLTDGPIQRTAPGETPHPVVMNAGAISEIRALNPNVVIVKGDLTQDGTDEEFAAFRHHYGSAFGDSLVVARGNHDAYRGQHEFTGDSWVTVPGLAVALLDTTIPTETTGRIDPEQFDWLDAHLSAATTPVIVMGHHQQWIEGNRSDTYFGLHPDSSDALDRLVVRHRNVIAYTAGHTHRHRVRSMALSGVPSIEIGCVKDFPGTWAEYRAYEGGVMQVVHRISTPDALAWSERCRHLYSDFGIDYETYAMGSLEERCLVFPQR
jgi:3',5'-cyclic AMP phosphodiesterase CpdA